MLASPLTIALLIAVGALLIRVRGRHRIARWMLWSAIVVGYLGSTSAVGNSLLAPLENRYPPLRSDAQIAGVTEIVVLGSGYAPHGGIPVTAALDDEGLLRIVEGVRLWRLVTHARLIVSGGAPTGGIPAAVGYEELAKGLGVTESSLVMLARPLNTNAEARAVATLIGSTPFILVTSAAHMPRAVRLMNRAGARPIPAPTGQRVQESPIRGWLSWSSWLPSSSGLRKTECAVHEYLGLAAIYAGMA